MTDHIKIAPSILAADFTRLGEQLGAAEAGGADLLHLDIMDGRFVPNISFGPLVVEAAKRVSTLALDVHLMIVEPERFIKDFISAGSSNITIHAEATAHVHRALQMIKAGGVTAGLVVNPLTSLDMIKEALPYLDRVLIMSVNPGFGGQTFIEGSIERIRQVASWIHEGSFDCDLEVDGGINEQTIAAAVRAGANVMVAGSAVFGSDDIASNIKRLRQLAQTAQL